VRKGKGKRLRGDMGIWCGGIWPTKKLWRGAPYARQLADRGREREGRGKERKGRRGAESRKRGREESWNRAADWLRPALKRSTTEYKLFLMMMMMSYPPSALVIALYLITGVSRSHVIE